MAKSVDENPQYWQEYSNLQRVKHALIREYLNGWFPKLGLGYFRGRVLYFDTHAGRGRHLSGELGSPLVALRTLLTHSFCARLLQHNEVGFHFIEHDQKNLDLLVQEIKTLGGLPSRVQVNSICGDCDELLQSLADYMRSVGSGIAPAFFFVDPYGFKISCKLLREVMLLGRVELFINVIWRELDMAIKNPKMPGTLDLVFDGPEWRERIDADDSNVRAQQTVDLLRDKIDAKWATHIHMLGKNDATRYLLLHLSNHDQGRDLMKECMWKVCPDCPEGRFYARKKDDLSQQYLLSDDPDLDPLDHWLHSRLSDGPARWDRLAEDLRPEIWLPKHLWKVIRALRDSQDIQASDYGARFSQKGNPLFSLS